MKHPNGYHVVDGVEFFYEDQFDKLYIKNKKGQLFLVNKTEEWAKEKGRAVVYRTSDDKLIIRASTTEKRRVNPKLLRSREENDAMHLSVLNGLWRLELDRIRPCTKKHPCSQCRKKKRHG
ncbi:MAG: hypothetical protein MN733_01435 [Nitrososphaera sp.]|nr:hypothetical protein [Nitrososphaera sp.]